MKSGLKTDVRVLLSKLYYASGLYEEALDELEKSGFENVCEVAQSVRNLQLMAEANAIKAHCLEKVCLIFKCTCSAFRRTQIHTEN